MEQVELLGSTEKRGAKGYIVFAAILLLVLVKGIIFTEPFDWQSNKPIPYGGVFHDMASASNSAKMIMELVGLTAISACILWHWFSKVKLQRTRFLSILGVILFALGCIEIFNSGINFCGHDVMLRLVKEEKTVALAGNTFKFTEKAVSGVTSWGILAWGLIPGLVLLGFAYLLQFQVKSRVGKKKSGEC